MRLKQLGRTKEMVPELGIGTWKMGATPEKEIEAIRRGVNLGMNLVDTAEMYANEGLIGAAIKGKENVFIETKVSPDHLGHNNVIKACKASLVKLGVKRIDLYMVHWPNPAIDIRETMSAMEELADKGIIRHIGVSNFSPAELDEARSAMKRHEIVSNQVEYSVLVRDIEEDVIPYCRKNKITVIAYSPIARGGMFDADQRALLDVLTRVGKKYGKTPVQVALNWVIAKDGVIAIPKASDVGHVEENSGASGWKMTMKEMSEIAEAAMPRVSIAKRNKPVVTSLPRLSSAYTKAQEFKNRAIKRITKKDGIEDK